MKQKEVSQSLFKMKTIFNLLGFIMVFLSFKAYAQQLPECGTNVPFFTLDLSLNPDSIYTTPEIVRQGQCCGGGGNLNYVSFYVTLHPDVAMVEIGIVPGYADPGGSGNYNIITGGDLVTPGICGPDIPGGQTACITGSGPHKITYYKPGKNKVKYYLKQIPKPIYPQDDTTRVGCSLPLNIYGLDNITITSINSSTGNTTPGAYNTLLSCTTCGNPSFNPGLATPVWIDYQICGTPQASACGVYQSCDTVRLYTANLLELSVVPNPAEFCTGGSVMLVSTAIGGDGNYTYNWFDSGGNLISPLNTYNATTEGTFTIEVADGLVSSTCPEEYLSVPVSIGLPPVVNAGPDQTVCASNPDVFLSGSVTNASGGIWSGGLGTYTPAPNSLLIVYTPTAAEILAGSVTLTLTSTGAGGGCSNSADDMTIFFSDTVFANPSYAAVLCNGGTTTVNANESGGTAPYTYSWSTGVNTPSIVASAGTYSVTVSDAYGCTAIAPVTVSEPSTIILSLSSTNTSTDLACDGTATVSISGGVGPYTVEWMDLQTTLTATGLCYGVATVTVTDALGCTSVGSVVVNNPTCSAFSVSASNTDVSCYGDASAQAFSFPSGGNAPYNYSWNTFPVQTSQNASGLSAGTYTVTVTDNVGCMDLASVTVVQPTIITVGMTHTDATSIGGNEGTATANPAGGTPGYTYLWNPTAQTTQTAVNLAQGVYYVNIQDANSCLKTDSVLINQPPCTNFMLGVNPSNTSCNGLSDGSAYIIIAQGTPPYSISWSSGETDVTSVSGLAAGSYSVTVTDASNCTTFENFDITEPNALSIGLVPTNISCFGSADGTIDLTVSGGTFPYTYQWTLGVSQIGTQEDLTHLKPGTYSVLVTDANGCTISGSVGVHQPNALTSSYTYTDITCNGDGNGTINATIGGGILPYTYNWSGPGAFSSTSEDISGLEEGLYELQILDGNGCSLNDAMQTYINEPDSILIVSYTLPCPLPGANSVALTIDSLSGGSGEPYSVSFNGGTTYGTPGIYSATLPLNASYSVLAMDDAGCTTPLTTTIIIDPKVEINAVTFNSCMPVGTTNINITVVAIGGDSGPYEVSTDGGTSYNFAGTYVLALPVGNSYSIVVRDGNGCESVAWPITIPFPLDASTVLLSEASCPGATDGSVDLTISGGTTAYSIAWTGPAAFSSSSEDLSGLVAGMYYYTITDANSCSFNDSIEVTTTPDVTLPVITFCSGNQSVVSDGGVCTYTVSGSTWDATATDDCMVASIIYNLTGATTGTGTTLNGVVFNLGTTTVLWTVTDGSGNVSTCTFDVVVTDDQLPSITSCGAAGTQNVVADGGVCTYTNSGTGWDALATDNCSVSTIGYALTGATTGTGISLNGVAFNLGTTTVLWTITDGSGNVSTCTFDVVVTDDQLPSISTCGAAGTQNVVADGGVCTYTNSGTGWDALATDNCSVSTIGYALTGATTGTGITLDGVIFNLGTTTVTWTVTDGSGNSSTCTFDVIVTDDQLPAITSCGAAVNQNVDADLGDCNYTNNGVAWDAAATDNCTVSTLLADLTGATSATGLSTLDGVAFNVGTTTVTWTVTDGSGNMEQCIFDVTVNDTQDPVITCPSDIIVNNDPTLCGAVINYSLPTATDNCSTFAQESIPGHSLLLNQGNTYYYLSDNPFDFATSNASALSLGGHLAYFETLAESDLFIGLGPTAYYIGGIQNMSSPSYSEPAGGWEWLDGTPISYSNWAPGEPNNSPVWGGEEHMTYFSGVGKFNDYKYYNLAPYLVELSYTGSITQIAGLPSGATFPVGTTTNTFVVTDAAGNTDTCSFNVIVSDNEIPIISTCGAAGTQNVVADGGVCTYTNSGTGWDALATDNCSVSTIGYALTGATTGSGTSLDGVVFNLGTTTVTWTVTDGSGNISTCTFDVVVTDDQYPAISSCGPGVPQNVVADGGLCTYTNSGTAWDAVVTDNCSVSSVSYNLSGATTGTGTTLDGVSFNLGATIVEWTATDGSGNASLCYLTVIVSDDQLPSISTCGATGTQNVVADFGTCTYTKVGSGWNATATDNCSVSSIAYTLTGATSGTGTTLNGVIFNLGTTTVTWTVTDGSGNISTCTFDVNVSDTQLPSITSCGAAGNQNVVANNGVCTYTVSGTGWDASAIDNCSVSSITYALTGATTGAGASLNGVVFNLGVTTVTWTATDGSGNTSTCTFNVTVTDNQLPSLVSCGPGGTQNVVADGGVCTYTNSGTAWDATAADNCSVSSLVYNLTGATTGSGTSLNGVVFNLGTTSVTWTVTDGSGNTSTCNFNVVVTDDQDPIISSCGAAGTQNVVADAGVCTYRKIGAGWNATATDNCGVSSVVYTLSGATSGTGTTLNNVVFNLGTTTVLWTVTDGSGNTSTCTFDVIVTDDQLPSITSCGPTGAQTVNANLGTCTYTYSGTGWNAQATDNCSVSSLTYTLTGATSGSGTSLNGVAFNLGVTQVTWTATDGSGNTSTCSFQVTVVDDQLPVILSCGAAGTQNVSTNPGVCTYTVSGTAWDATASDNCSVASVNYALSGATSGSGSSLNGVSFAQGTTLVTWTATDGSGNIASCSFTVVVSDNEVPVISGCPSNISVNNDNGACSAVVSWTPPTFTDNCSASMTSNLNPGATFSVGTTTVTYTVTDGAGNVSVCSFSVTVTDNELPQMTCNANSASCNPVVTFTAPSVSDNCGVASVTQTAGLPSGSTFPVGTTTVTYQALDIHGNTNTCSFTVTIYPTPVVSTVSTDVTCNGAGDGSIDLTVSNGTAPYTYNWTNGASSQDLSNLQPGIYGVNVTDNNGCSASISDTIAEPAVLVLSKEVSQVLCYNGNNGAIDLTISGGTQPYTFNWSNGATSEDLSNLSAGVYSVVVTDANGCQVTNSTTLLQPDSITIQTVVTNATCNAENGAVSVLVTGGVSPYDYSWSNGSTSLNLSNVPGGTYTLTITDENGCVATHTDSVGSSSNLSGYIYATDVLCHGENTGTALAVIETGNTPFTYSWSNGETSNFIEGLSVGQYSVHVVDVFGCQIDLSVDIAEPDSLYIELYSAEPLDGYNISVNGGSDGSIQSTVNGGTPQYTYEWSNGSTTADVYGLTSGQYTLIVTDANGCSASAAIRLVEPGILEMPEGLSPNGDGQNDFFVIHGIEAYPNNEIAIYNRWGNVVYERSGYNNEWQGENSKGELLPDGTYFVIFKPTKDAVAEPLTGYVDLRRSR